MKVPCDDSTERKYLSKNISGREVLVLCPGDSLIYNEGKIKKFIKSHSNLVTISVGFKPQSIDVDYIFCSNMRRYKEIRDCSNKKIITSNIKNIAPDLDEFIQYESIIGTESLVYDNAGIMVLRLLSILSPKKISIVGMDGYLKMSQIDENRDVKDSEDCFVESFNAQMSVEIGKIKKIVSIDFLTDSFYIGARLF